MNAFPEFQPFPKVPRLFREAIITEKIDGTNGCINITDGIVRAGSRNRWLTLESDNFGFAKWVSENNQELLKLGPGTHYGEWWGSGIQRGYGLKEKRFSLFNVTKWADNADRPACCSVVPVLYSGTFYTTAVLDTLSRLDSEGSIAAPGFMKPEGIIVYHVAAHSLFKVTLENDENPKGIVC